MTAIAEALERFRRQPSPSEGSTTNPFKLVSTIASPAGRKEIDEAWAGSTLPNDLRELWTASREARLFEDVEYGQWGLVLLSPESSANRTAREREARPAELRPDDVIFGEFLGDQELAVLAPSETGRRRIVVALPLDNRADWFAAASSLEEFLRKYFDAAGEKYWEHLGIEADDHWS